MILMILRICRELMTWCSPNECFRVLESFSCGNILALPHLSLGNTALDCGFSLPNMAGSRDLTNLNTALGIKTGSRTLLLVVWVTFGCFTSNCSLTQLRLHRSWRLRSDSEEDVPYAKMSNGITYGTEPLKSTTTKSSSLWVFSVSFTSVDIVCRKGYYICHSSLLTLRFYCFFMHISDLWLRIIH